MNPDAIILHGACASGKTSCAKAFQLEFQEPFLHISADYFAGTLPPKDLTPPAWSPEGLGIKIIREYYQFCAHLVNQGFKVIVDHMAIGTHYQELFIYPSKEQGRQVLSVRIYSSLEECERRERESPNKKVGLSRLHYDEVYQAPCDIEVNSMRNTPKECALQVIEFVSKFESL